MKKLSAFLIVMLLISTSAFAMASKPAKGSYYWYVNEPYNVCAAYGNPWVPNKAPQYNDAEWKACAQPYYDYAFNCFKGGKKVACNVGDPA